MNIFRCAVCNYEGPDFTLLTIRGSTSIGNLIKSNKNSDVRPVVYCPKCGVVQMGSIAEASNANT